MLCLCVCVSPTNILALQATTLLMSDTNNFSPTSTRKYIAKIRRFESKQLGCRGPCCATKLINYWCACIYKCGRSRAPTPGGHQAAPTTAYIMPGAYPEGGLLGLEPPPPFLHIMRAHVMGARGHALRPVCISRALKLPATELCLSPPLPQILPTPLHAASTRRTEEGRTY